MRALLLLPVALIATACGERAEAPAQPPPVLVATPPPPMPPAPEPTAQPIDERFATTRDGWRVDYQLSLPALPAEQSRRLRRACTAWLFQGLADPRPTIAESGEAALATLIADGGQPGGAEPWYSERAVTATLHGRGWLALRRAERAAAGGAQPTSRLEGLIIAVDDGVRALVLDEVIPPEQQAGLRALLAAQLRQSRGLPADGPLTSEIASDAELPIPLPLLDRDGARFVWNAYEIGPLSDGAYEATVPAAQMRAFLAVDPW